MIYGTAFFDGGFRPVIAKTGRKWTQVVYADGTRVRVRKTKRPIITRPIDNYTLAKLARRMLRKKNVLGLKREISKGARAILEQAKGEVS